MRKNGWQVVGLLSLAVLCGVVACTSDLVTEDAASSIDNDSIIRVFPGKMQVAVTPANRNVCSQGVAVRDSAGQLLYWNTTRWHLTSSKSAASDGVKLFRRVELSPVDGRSMTDLQCVVSASESERLLIASNHLKVSVPAGKFGVAALSLMSGGPTCYFPNETSIFCDFGDGSAVYCTTVYMARPMQHVIAGAALRSGFSMDCWIVGGASPDPFQTYTSPPGNHAGTMEFNSSDGFVSTGADFSFFPDGGCFGPGCGGYDGTCFDDVRANVRTGYEEFAIARGSMCVPCQPGYHHLSGYCVNDESVAPPSFQPAAPDSDATATTGCKANPTCATTLRDIDSTQKAAFQSWLNTMNTSIPICNTVKVRGTALLNSNRVKLFDGPELLIPAAVSGNGRDVFSVGDTHNISDTTTIIVHISDHSTTRLVNGNFVINSLSDLLKIFRHEMGHVATQEGESGTNRMAIGGTCGW